MKQKCKYARHHCSRYQYRNYKFCFQHILEDKSAPFIPCQYISKTTQRRCRNAALKNPHATIVLCESHQQATNSSPHGKSSKKSVFLFESSNESTVDTEDSIEKSLHEFSDSIKFESAAAESFVSDVAVNNNWLTAMSPSWKYGEADLDTDSCDDDNNPLKNAGVHTLEEVVSISKQCLMRLRTLYMKQFGHLNRQLHAKRKKYLLNDYISDEISSDCKLSKDKRKEELHFLLNYRLHKWGNRILHEKSKKRRKYGTSSSLNDSASSSTKSKCYHIRCKNSSIPYSKYCNTHILEDPLQVLYQKCSNDSCSAPVCTLWSYFNKSNDNESFCPLHQSLPPISNDLVLIMEKLQEDLTNLPKKHNEIEDMHSDYDITSDNFTSPALNVSDDRANAYQEDGCGRNPSSIANIFELFNVTDPMITSNAAPNVSMDCEQECSSGKTTDSLKQLSSDNKLFKTEQSFSKNRTYVYGEEKSSCKSTAIHLESVEPSPVGTDDFNVAEDENSSNKSKMSPDNRKASGDCEIQKCETTTSSVSEIHHGNTILSIDNNLETESDEKHRRVTTASTVIPPLEEETSNSPDIVMKDDDQTLSTDEDKILSKMPPLAPIDHETKSFSNIATSESASEISNQLESQEVVHPLTSQLRITSTADCEFSNEEPVDHQDDKYCLETIVQRSVTPTNDLSDSSSNEACRNVKGGDADDAAHVNERKPSSADEETAVASLLFLSSGALQNH